MKILKSENIQAIGEKIYKQHNAITSGRYDFTACQLDILFMILANLRAKEINYSIHTSDIEIITGRKWNISQLTDSTEQLLTRMFEIETSEEYSQFVLFQHFRYIKGTRTIEVRLSETALPYFFDLKNNFTHFQLKSVLGCSSSYAKRLYMLACQWRTVGKFPKPIPIVELKRMLGLVDKKGNEQLERISQFKERVLDIAKRQINEYTDITFDYELFKRGRSFELIQIYVSTTKGIPKQLEIDYKEPLDFQKNIRTIMAYGLSKEHAILIVKDGIDKFTDFVKKVNERAKKGEISVDNAAAYIVGSYQKKGIIPKG
ncbi:replication initiation protein [Sphingobacterium rhinopitheci]|uniref:replication initiation protein n=1 Tax=Sphingobacterium rhinopitheci TaxID=2781960 RepID=UPI001F5270FF|nr:replication initiation protein [Sphingobacterium rhinopitheci]MCI0922731.1 replication initiation protein [Sphingobacterium rhinopitheci]